jgi:hypothetical protein
MRLRWFGCMLILAASGAVAAAGESRLSDGVMARTFGACEWCWATHHDWGSCPTEDSYVPPLCVSDGNCGTAKYYTGNIYAFCFPGEPGNAGYCVQDPDELCSRTYLVQGWLLADYECTSSGCVVKDGNSCLKCHDYDTWYLIEEEWMEMEHCEGW